MAKGAVRGLQNLHLRFKSWRRLQLSRGGDVDAVLPFQDRVESRGDHTLNPVVHGRLFARIPSIPWVRDRSNYPLPRELLVVSRTPNLRSCSICHSPNFGGFIDGHFGRKGVLTLRLLDCLQPRQENRAFCGWSSS
jgi:hypothetical protein